jgi:hypothetical protein
MGWLMDHFPAVAVLGALVFLLLLVALLALRAFGPSSNVPYRWRWYRLMVPLFLIGVGVVVLLVRARPTGNWPWGLVALGFILFGCYILVKQVAVGLSRRSRGTNAERA